MILTKEDEQKVVNFAVFGYGIEKMANILNVEVEQIQSAMADTESTFYKMHKKGNDLADYAIDLKIFEMARNGDLKAIEKLERRRRLNKT